MIGRFWELPIFVISPLFSVKWKTGLQPVQPKPGRSPRPIALMAGRLKNGLWLHYSLGIRLNGLE